MWQAVGSHHAAHTNRCFPSKLQLARIDIIAAYTYVHAIENLGTGPLLKRMAKHVVEAGKYLGGTPLVELGYHLV